MSKEEFNRLLIYQHEKLRLGISNNPDRNNEPF